MRHRRNPNCDPSFPDFGEEWRQSQAEYERLKALGDFSPQVADYSYAYYNTDKCTPGHALAPIPYRNGFPYVPTRDGS